MSEITELFKGRIYEPWQLTIVKREIGQALMQKKVCPNCRGLEECPFPAPGYQVVFSLDGSDMYQFPTFVYRRCGKLQQKAATDVVVANIEKRFYSKTFEAYDQSVNPEAYKLCLLYAQNFSKNTSAGLMLSGPEGTGKTHLASAILHAVLEKGYTGALITVPDLLDEIRYTFDTPGADRRLSRKLAEKQLVILDDLGAERATDWAGEELFKLINRRYEKELPIIITTNLTPKEIELRYKNGRKIVDRLAEMCKPILVLGKSYRRKKGKRE